MVSISDFIPTSQRVGNPSALLFLLLLSCVLGGRPGFAFQANTDGYGHALRWPPHACSYYINDAGGPAGFSAAFQAAMQTWTDVASADFVFNYVGTTASHDYGVNDGLNITDVGALSSGSIIAQNWIWYNFSGQILDSDIRFNSALAWSAAGEAGYFDLQNIATHELGHSLSLADLYSGADSEKTMYGYGATSETKKRTLDPDDVNGISYLYPAPLSLLAPSGVTASDGAYSNKIRIAWNAVSGATGYRIWRHTNNNAEAAAWLGADSASPYDDLTVLSNRNYYYWVAATNATLTSTLSAVDAGYCLSSNAPLADLVLTNLIFLPHAVQAGAVPDVVSFELINRGPAELAFPDQSVVVDFYLSNDSTFGDADDISFGSCAMDAALGAGGDTVISLSESERAQLALPRVIAYGAYVVFARVAHAPPSAMFDLNPTNNVARRTGTIAVGDRNGYHLAPNDYNGDRISEMAVYETASGNWFIRRVRSVPILYGESWGGPSLVPFAGDFNNDRKTDLAAYHEPSGSWFARPLTAGNIVLWGLGWGGSGFTPIGGDYDGDGGSDVAVYHEQSGLWFAYSASSGDVPLWGNLWGGPGYLPVPGDYDGDSWYDLAVYNPTSSRWFIQSAGGSNIAYNLSWGGPGLIPVPGDYDGDGVFDLAVYQLATGGWFIRTLDGALIAFGDVVGGAGSVPVSGDYNGDGKYDLAVYNESRGTWTIITTAGVFLENATRWGGIGMKAVGASW